MSALEIRDPKLYCLTLATAIDEFRKRLENLAGYATCPEESPHHDPEAFAEAEYRGLDLAVCRIQDLIKIPLANAVLEWDPWSPHAVDAICGRARRSAYQLVSELKHDAWSTYFGAWSTMTIEGLANVVGAAALLKDLAKQLELKSE